MSGMKDAGLGGCQWAGSGAGALVRAVVAAAVAMWGWSAACGQDEVLRWNAATIDSVRALGVAPPKAARDLAMVSIATADAVNAIDGQWTTYNAIGPASGPALREAAAAGAAHAVLSELYPARQSLFDAQLAQSLSLLPAGAARDEGLRLGQVSGAAMLARRVGDGSTVPSSYAPTGGPGRWVPTPTTFRPAALPQWCNVQPFVMTSPSEFRQAGPPGLSSDRYAQSYEEIRSLGRVDSTTRTDEQTRIARFWAQLSGSATPPGQWNQIAERVSAQQGLTITQNARMFAMLNAALADAGVAAWDMKYHFDTWRPVTAIRAGDSDGNAATVGDPNWLPLLETPNHPEYASGHSTFSAAAAGALAGFFGTDQMAFTAVSDDLPGEVRSYTSFSQAAREAGRSRIYGGIHFQFTNQDSLAAGFAIGDLVTRSVFVVPAPGAAAACVLAGLVAARRRRA